MAKHHLETREVQEAAYLGPNKGRTKLTHAILVAEDGSIVRVICGRAMLSSIGFSNTPFDASQEPTCRPCRQKTRGMKFGKEQKR
jgi:hypothetical protein